MDKHSYVFMSLMVLCMLPLYCDMRSANGRLNYDVMDGIDDNDDGLQSRKRHRIAYDQKVSVLKLQEQRSPEQKQYQEDEKPVSKKVKRIIKSRRRPSKVKTRQVKSRMRPLKSSQRFVRKLKAALVELTERKTELNKNDTKGNVIEESQKDDEERNLTAVTENKRDVNETQGVTLSHVTEDDKKPERQKIRIKIGDIIREYDETEYCESIFLPKEPLDIGTELDEKENEIDDTEETQEKMKREYDEEDYGELELKKHLSKGGENETEEILGNVKRDYNISDYKGKEEKEEKDDSCVDTDGSINKIIKSHSLEVRKKHLKVKSKNKIGRTKNTRLLAFMNHRKIKRTRN